MATSSASNVRLPINENAFPTWRDAFDGDTKRTLINEDLEAGRTVTRVLVTIVTGGLLLGIFAVILSLTVRFQ